MKIVDCFWEQKNIGKKTVEICIEPTDRYDENVLMQCIRDYEYAVIKVPMNMPMFNFGLSRMGFCCIETQLNLSIAFQNFDFSLVKHLYDDTTYHVVEREVDYQDVISQIEPGMFSTDRISLDPVFGETIGRKRYVNWISNELLCGSSRLIRIYYGKSQVGFMLIKIDDKNVRLLLNGLYKKFQGMRLGLLTPASPYMYAKRNNLFVEKETTSISSNNIPAAKLYDRLHFQRDSQTYVFVKHLK